MKNIRILVQGSLLASLMALASACVVAEPREGYYDGPHHRYYHEHTWHECVVGDPFCR
jgi:hypothetical protein